MNIDSLIGDLKTRIRRLEGPFYESHANYYQAKIDLLEELRPEIDSAQHHLRAVLEHLAPILKLYEPNLPEHPVIAAIRDYLEHE